MNNGAGRDVPVASEPEFAGARWRVFRDPHGVPHVQGDDVESLAEGHGAATAVDRVWHLEVLRRRAEARSAALLGEDHVDADHLSAAMRVEATAQRWWAAAEPADRAFLAAYARGVNQRLARAWRECSEALALGVAEQQPRPWDPWTPVAVHIEHHVLAGSLPEQLWRSRVRETLGEQWIPVLDAEALRSAGSNAWLVPGHLSVTGVPLIAADPHRIVEESGPYQPVCFSAPGLRVRGLALTGLPGVPHFGRTESAAWAITASMVTGERLEQITVTRRDGVLTEVVSGEALDEDTVVLPTPAEPGRTRRIRSFRGAPILPGDTVAEDHLAALGPRETAVLTTVRSSVPRDPARALHACRSTLSATTTTQVLQAFDGWALPLNDLVAADSTGACANTVVGSFTDARGVAVVSPVHDVTGITVRANQRPTDAVEATWRLGCAPAHRARRAQALLESAVENHGVITHDDLLNAQTDTQLDAWPKMLSELFTDAFPRDPGDDGRLGTLRDRLLAWDGSMDPRSPDAALFARWRDGFARHLAADPLLDTLRAPTGLPGLWAPFLDVLPRVGLALESVIHRGASVGLDPGSAARRALQDLAVQELVATPPASTVETARWESQPWGQLHAFRPLRAHPDLTPWPAVEVGGDTDCLLATGTLPGCGTGCLRVPSARVLWDLSDPAASLWITPDPVNRGASPTTPLQRWAAGRTDQALPWVPGGALATGTGGVINLGEPLEGSHAVLRPVVPGDFTVIHEWVSAPRARFWGMNGFSRRQVGEIYEYLAASPTHHAWMVEVNGEPSGIVQTYQPHADPAGATYRVEPGDLGAHVLLAPSSVQVPGLTAALTSAVIRVAARGGTLRVVVEPDVGNAKAIQRMLSVGFVLGPKIELPGKTGQLAFLNLV